MDARVRLPASKGVEVTGETPADYLFDWVRARHRLEARYQEDFRQLDRLGDEILLRAHDAGLTTGAIAQALNAGLGSPLEGSSSQAPYTARDVASMVRDAEKRRAFGRRRANVR